MIDLQALFVLPLMHHLVQQGVSSLVPSVAPDMPPTDNDFRGVATLTAPRVVAEPAAHPARDPNRNTFENTLKLLLVEVRVPSSQLAGEPLIGGMGLLG